MTNKLYFFIGSRIVFFFLLMGVMSELLNDSHEFFNDQFVDMDDQSNWDCVFITDSCFPIRDCAFESPMYICPTIDHWHWSWIHCWVFWMSIALSIFQLIFFVIQINDKIQNK